MPVLSIVIPTLNRDGVLRSTISQVLDQRFRAFELWIVDQSDPEQAAANLQFVERLDDARLRYLHIPIKNLANARNEAIRRCAGDIILFLDDDVILLGPDFLSAHVEAYRAPKVGGVTGRSVERFVTMNARKTACYVATSGRIMFNLFGLEAQPIDSCKGSNMSFRASVFSEVGGFDRQTELLEDTDFSVRVGRRGWLLLFEPKAELVHLSEASGGVRAPDNIQTEVKRFRFTSYYVLKHRGLLGFVPFVSTFSLIALHRTIRFRSLGALRQLWDAVLDGYRMSRIGPDEVITGMEKRTDCSSPHRKMPRIAERGSSTDQAVRLS